MTTVTDGSPAAIKAPVRKIRRRRFRHLDGLISFAILIVGLTVWQVSVVYFKVPGFVFPAPLEVASWVVRGFSVPVTSNASFLMHLGITAYEAAIGFVVGCVVGVCLGFTLAHNSRAERIVYPYIQAFNALPKIAIAPLMVVWLGFGLEPKIWMAAILVFFPMLVNAMAGYHSVDPDRIDLARACSATRAQIFWKIIVPSSMPFLFAGLHMASVLAVLGAIVGEFVGARAGLGMLLLQYNNNMQVGGVFAVLIVLGAIGYGLNVVLQQLEARICFWARRTKSFRPN